METGVICGVSLLGDAGEDGVVAPVAGWAAGVGERVTGVRCVMLWIGLSNGPLVEALVEWLVLESVTAPMLTKMMTTAEKTSCLRRAFEMMARVERKLLLLLVVALAPSSIDW